MQVRIEIADGICPVQKRHAQKAKAALRLEQKAESDKEKNNTFESIARQWVKDRLQNGYWKHNAKGEFVTSRILEKYVFPYLGKRHIDRITPEMVRDMLAPIWQRTPSTAKKAKTYTCKIFQWAIALHLKKNPDNPADWKGPLCVLMESYMVGAKPKQNHAACRVSEIPLLFKQTKEYESITARAVEFSILTSARSQAVRWAKWDEFDLENKTWTIPLEHDKIKTPNRDRTIYLSDATIHLLNSLPRFRECDYVFVSRQGGYLSDVAMTMFLRGLHEKRLAQDGIGWIDPIKTKVTGKPSVITIHGTARATFRTWAKDDELGNNRKFDQEAVELCMLHSKKDEYDGAYDRAPLEKERRYIMQCWGLYCTSLL